MVALGATGYWILGHGRWQFAECVYMTVITLSTVGFGELSQMHEVPGARPLTIMLIVSGVGALAYVQGNLTALLVEGVIGQVLRRNRMRNAIAKLTRHVVVAGAGSTGKHVIEELVATGTPFVVIDRDLAHLERLSEDILKGRMLFVNGDATDDRHAPGRGHRARPRRRRGPHARQGQPLRHAQRALPQLHGADHQQDRRGPRGRRR